MDWYDIAFSESLVLDVIAELGQSNMEGRDGDTANPLYPFTSTSGFYFNDFTEHPISTDRGGSINGSHANYFAEKYFSLTKKKSVLVESATGGAGLTTTSATGNWSSSGTLRGSAESSISQALTYYKKSTPYAALWCQGERDAQEMDSNGAYTKAMVKAGMQDVIDWWQATYPNAPFLISETGDFSDSSNTLGFQDMRAVQNEIVAENTGVYMAFTGAKDFGTSGKMIDSLHYSYVGYKEMGEAFATKLSTI